MFEICNYSTLIHAIHGLSSLNSCCHRRWVLRKKKHGLQFTVRSQDSHVVEGMVGCIAEVVFAL